MIIGISRVDANGTMKDVHEGDIAFIEKDVIKNEMSTKVVSDK